jgi:hypothetical protein
MRKPDGLATLSRTKRGDVLAATLIEAASADDKGRILVGPR